MSMTWK